MYKTEIETKHELMVLGLAKDGQELIKGLTPKTAHNLHMAIGISGEVAELVEAMIDGSLMNLVEEIGDCYFYITGLIQGAGVQPHYVNYSDYYNAVGAGMYVYGAAMKLSICAGFLLDAVKKEAIYNKPLDLIECEKQLSIILCCLETIMKSRGITKEQCLQANYDKLGKRYENHQYSDEQAQQRKDKNGES